MAKPKKQELQHGSNLKIVKEVAKPKVPADNKEVTLKTRYEKINFALDVIYNENVLSNSKFNVLATSMAKKNVAPAPVEKAKDKKKN